MTINHSIPHQQLLPNVTLLLIKIHPAARHWGTNDLEIGSSVSQGLSQAPPGEEEVHWGSEAGRDERHQKSTEHLREGLRSREHTKDSGTR